MKRCSFLPETAFHNRFDITLTDAESGTVRCRARAFNVVCDALWTRLFCTGTDDALGGDYFRYIVYGSGSGTPYSFDTRLFARAGAAELREEDGRRFSCSVDTETDTVSVSGHIRLGTSDAIGVTITEVGIGYDDYHIVNHAMLEDMNGNPLSVTKTDTDILDITATVFLHFPTNEEGAYRFLLPRSGEDALRGGLIPWLAGAFRETEMFCAEGLPCRYLLATAELPEALPIPVSSGLPTDAGEARTLSFSAEERKYRVSFRFPGETGNITGGIRYLALCSRMPGTEEDSGDVLIPELVFPYTGENGRTPIRKDEEHLLFFDAEISFMDGAAG